MPSFARIREPEAIQMAQQMDDVIDRQPETNCDENRRAHSEEQLRRLRIASAFIAASSSRGSRILGLVGFEGGIQEIAHGLRSSFSLG